MLKEVIASLIKGINYCRGKNAIPVLLAILLTNVTLTVKADTFMSVSGVNGELKSKILNHLKTLELPCTKGLSENYAIQRRLDKELKSALQALGYFHAQWSKQFEPHKKCEKLSININLGTSITVRTAALHIQGEASQDQTFQKFILAAKLNPGTAFNSSAYDQLKEKIQARGRRLGYLDAAFTQQQVDIYPSLNVADITLIWDSGPRYRIGEVRIDQSVLENGLFQELLSIKSGEFYDLSKIQSDRQRLSESNYFATLEIKPRTEQRQDRYVPVEVLATAANPATYQVGIGYSTDTGARIRGDYTRQRVNIRGHKTELKFLLSEVMTTLNFNYVVPWRDPKTDSLRGDLSYIEEDNDSFFSERWEASITGNVKKSSGWRQSLSTTLSSENAEIASENDHSLHLVPAIRLSKISTDNPIYPEKGYSLSFALLGSLEGVLSDSSFLQFKTTAKYISPLPFNLRFVARTELASTLLDSITDLPASRRFFTGGDNSIRGYEYQSLGPKSGNEVTGGRHLAIGSLELEHQIYKKWSLAVFADGGNAWDEASPDLVYSLGVGLRWRSPIGPFRLDIGVPMKEDKGDFRIHLNLGPEL